MKKAFYIALAIILLTFAVVFGKGGWTPKPDPKPSTSVSASPSASPSPLQPSASPTEQPGTQFPNASNTGVPSGKVLTELECPGDTITISVDGSVINGKLANCDVQIKAVDVLIKDSRIVGSVYTPDGALNYSFTIEDSEVTYPVATDWGKTMIGEANFTVIRTEVTGGNRGIYCRKNCVVKDSWVHGTKVLGTQHASAVRVSQGATLIHNTLHCDVEDIGDAGCSANMTGYPDFESVKNNTVERNLFKATPGGFCAYAGATNGKPYSNASDNATGIVLRDNVFEKGSGGKCGFWGAVTDYEPGRTGNVWEGNTWDDGTELTY